MNEPKQFRVGDTVKWKEPMPKDPDGNALPSSDWTLKYELQGPEKHTITATADGSDYQINIPASTSKMWQPGWYNYVAYVEGTPDDADTEERYTVGSGKFELLPNIVMQQGGVDGRSEVRITLEKINKAIREWADKPQVLTIGSGIGTRSITYKSLPDLLKARSTYSELLKQEEAADDIAKGLNPGRKILTRFSKAG